MKYLLQIIFQFCGFVSIKIYIIYKYLYWIFVWVFFSLAKTDYFECSLSKLSWVIFPQRLLLIVYYSRNNEVKSELQRRESFLIVYITVVHDSNSI